MTQHDYCNVLGIDKNASESDISKACHELAKKYHPDLNHEPGTEERYEEVNEACEVLHDKQKKAQYDQLGQAGVNGQTGFGGQDYGGFDGQGGYSSQGFGNSGDIFSGILGSAFDDGRSRANPTAPQKGRDLDYATTVDSMDAIKGKKTDTIYIGSEVCPTCSGSSAEKGTHPVTYDECHGTGVMTTTHQTPLGVVQQQTTCDKRSRRGMIIKHPCQACYGKGTIDKKQTLEVKVPAGVDNGQRIRLGGQGEAGKDGGPYGDLYTVFKAKLSKEFRRNGTTIYSEAPVSFAQAALGGKIHVDIVHGPVDLTIPASTQPNTNFRLRGQGVPKISGTGNGDQEITVKVVIPEEINDKQKEALVDYVKAGGGNISLREKNFSEHLKGRLNGE